MSQEVKSAEIFLWDSPVGVLYVSNDRNAYRFEYDNDFINSGIEISPFMMPLSSNVYEFASLNHDTFKGLPGLVADSLPDRFGNAVIDRWLAINGRLPSSVNAIERLCYTGKRGMGALEYIPDKSIDNMNEEIDIDGLVKLASEVLDKKQNIKLDIKNLQMSNLLKLGTSAGGARAKAIIALDEKNSVIKSGEIDAGKNFTYWILKFDGIEGTADHDIKYDLEYTKIEYAYYLMAKDCGININESRIFEINGLNHFITKRFDRYVENGKMKKIHMQSLCGLTHLDYNTPRVCSYEMLASYCKKLNYDMCDVEQVFARMVFNVLAINCDDHTKNFSFLMDKSGNWRLSPAYDLTFAYKEGNKWLSSHQMTINGKSESFSYEDLITSGTSMDLKKSKCVDIINKTIETLSNWDKYANIANISEGTMKMIDNLIKSEIEHIAI